MQTSGNVILKLKVQGQWGKKMVLPVVGVKDIGTDGTFEVEDHVATILLRQSNDFLLVEGNGTTVDEKDYSHKMETKPESESKTEENTGNTPPPSGNDDNESDEDSEGDADSESDEESDGLDDMKLSELIEIAEGAQYEFEEYKKFAKNKKLMVAFLRKKAKGVTEE